MDNLLWQSKFSLDSTIKVDVTPKKCNIYELWMHDIWRKKYLEKYI